MVSIGPYTQAYDMKQMYDLPDRRRESEKKKCSYPDHSLMGEINSNPNFTIFAKIAKKARFDTKLSELQADFTVFVPADSYLRKKYNQEFLNNMDIGLAIQIMNFSMMRRQLDQNILQSSPVSIFPTIDRSSSMNMSTVNSKTMLENCVSVIHWNHPATNGLIHVVDDLLIPSTSVHRVRLRYFD